MKGLDNIMDHDSPAMDQDNTTISHLLTKPKKCPACGYMNPHTRTECRKCKTPLPDHEPTLRCPECGNEVYQSEPKCKYCGLSMEEIKAHSNSTYVIEHSSKPNSQSDPQ